MTLQQEQTIRDLKEELQKTKLQLQVQKEITQKKYKIIEKFTKTVNELKFMWSFNILKRGGNLEFMHTQHNM